jgi:hypothetical protein
MAEMPAFESCDELVKKENGEKATFSFSKEPIATLPFTGPEGLKWEDFERLCCRLMARLYNLHGYTRYGRGPYQEGIDIFGYRTVSPDSLVVIQIVLSLFSAKSSRTLTYQHSTKPSTNISAAGFMARSLNS